MNFPQDEPVKEAYPGEIHDVQTVNFESAPFCITVTPSEQTLLHALHVQAFSSDASISSGNF